MIIRIKKRDCPYVQIDKRALENPALSWRAKGILAYLLSKPDGWTVKIDDIMSHGKEGRDAVANAMKELRSSGYAWTEKPRSDDGLLRGEVWIISEEPRCPEKPVPGLTGALKNRQPEKPAPGESATSNNKGRDNNGSNTAPLKAAPKQPLEEFVASLKANPGYKGIDIDRELSRMDAWLQTPKGRRRQKTHQFILNWLNKAEQTLDFERGSPPGGRPVAYVHPSDI